MAFELKYPELNFRKATPMEALLLAIEPGEYFDPDVRAAFNQHIKPDKTKMIVYYFDELNYQGHIQVVGITAKF